MPCSCGRRCASLRLALRLKELKLMNPVMLWVNVGVRGLREAWTREFVGLCVVHEIQPTELSSPQLDDAWDVVCFNFDFPDSAGLKLVTETKKRWPSAPLLMLTMQPSVDLTLWALRARVFDLLAKPISAREIERCMQRVQDALEARRSQSGRSPQSAPTLMPVESRYRPRAPSATRLQLALAHIAKHSVRHIPATEVAHACRLSPSRFCHEFKAAFGVTFVAYLASFRVKQAQRLLTNRNMSIADVAAAVGFDDPSYFTRVFRKQMRVSPSEYRLRETALL